ncbi:hypothetical protein HKX48_001105 [Thoreauomyces humboldtii]|nr:hypothetical protein HKX48_001105 [Thoreauomyces humboldtii]
MRTPSPPSIAPRTQGSSVTPASATPAVRMPGRWPTAKKAATNASKRALLSPNTSPTLQRRNPLESPIHDSVDSLFTEPSGARSQYASRDFGAQSFDERDMNVTSDYDFESQGGTAQMFQTPRANVSDSEDSASSPHRQLFSPIDMDFTDDFDEDFDYGDLEDMNVSGGSVSVLKRRASEATRRYTELDKSLRIADDQIHALQNRIDELESELGEKRRECTELRTKDEQQRNTIEHLELTIMTLKKQLTTAKSNSVHLRQQFEQLTVANQKLTDEKHLNETALSDADSSLHSCQNELRKTLESKARLEDDISRLTEDLEAADHRMRELRAENSHLKDTIEGLNTSLEEAATRVLLRKEQFPQGSLVNNKVLQRELEGFDSTYGSESGQSDAAPSSSDQREQEGSGDVWQSFNGAGSLDDLGRSPESEYNAVPSPNMKSRIPAPSNRDLSPNRAKRSLMPFSEHIADFQPKPVTHSIGTQASPAPALVDEDFLTLFDLPPRKGQAIGIQAESPSVDVQAASTQTISSLPRSSSSSLPLNQNEGVSTGSQDDRYQAPLPDRSVGIQSNIHPESLVKLSQTEAVDQASKSLQIGEALPDMMNSGAQTAEIEITKPATSESSFQTITSSLLRENVALQTINSGISTAAQCDPDPIVSTSESGVQVQIRGDIFETATQSEDMRLPLTSTDAQTDNAPTIQNRDYAMQSENLRPPLTARDSQTDSAPAIQNRDYATQSENIRPPLLTKDSQTESAIVIQSREFATQAIPAKISTEDFGDQVNLSLSIVHSGAQTERPPTPPAPAELTSQLSQTEAPASSLSSQTSQTDVVPTRSPPPVPTLTAQASQTDIIPVPTPPQKPSLSTQSSQTSFESSSLKEDPSRLLARLQAETSAREAIEARTVELESLLYELESDSALWQNEQATLQSTHESLHQEVFKNRFAIGNIDHLDREFKRMIKDLKEDLDSGNKGIKGLQEKFSWIISNCKDREFKLEAQVADQSVTIAHLHARLAEQAMASTEREENLRQIRTVAVQTRKSDSPPPIQPLALPSVAHISSSGSVSRRASRMDYLRDTSGAVLMAFTTLAAVAVSAYITYWYRDPEWHNNPLGPVEWGIAETLDGLGLYRIARVNPV